MVNIYVFDTLINMNEYKVYLLYATVFIWLLEIN